MQLVARRRHAKIHDQRQIEYASSLSFFTKSIGQM